MAGCIDSYLAGRFDRISIDAAADRRKGNGGKVVFYGGMDIQHLLPFGSEEDVRAEVRRNVDCFAECGGYVVANSHHCIASIKPENMMAMADEARRHHPRRGKK